MAAQEGQEAMLSIVNDQELMTVPPVASQACAPQPPPRPFLSHGLLGSTVPINVPVDHHPPCHAPPRRTRFFDGVALPLPLSDAATRSFKTKGDAPCKYTFSQIHGSDTTQDSFFQETTLPLVRWHDARLPPTLHCHRLPQSLTTMPRFVLCASWARCRGRPTVLPVADWCLLFGGCDPVWRP